MTLLCAPIRWFYAIKVEDRKKSANAFHLFSSQTYEEPENRIPAVWLKQKPGKEFFTKVSRTKPDSNLKNWFLFTRCDDFNTEQITVYSNDDRKLAYIAF